jgi:hypothetical protein
VVFQGLLGITFTLLIMLYQSSQRD